MWFIFWNDTTKPQNSSILKLYVNVFVNIFQPNSSHKGYEKSMITM
jgi:hypothetical protein